MTLKRDLTCPACGRRRVLRIERPLDREELMGRVVETRARVAGIPDDAAVEAYLCGACGLLEWYAMRPDLLVPNRWAGVHLVSDDPPPEGPYR